MFHCLLLLGRKVSKRERRRKRRRKKKKWNVHQIFPVLTKWI